MLFSVFTNSDDVVGTSEPTYDEKYVPQLVKSHVRSVGVGSYGMNSDVPSCAGVSAVPAPIVAAVAFSAAGVGVSPQLPLSSRSTSVWNAVSRSRSDCELWPLRWMNAVRSISLVPASANVRTYDSSSATG